MVRNTRNSSKADALEDNILSLKEKPLSKVKPKAKNTKKAAPKEKKAKASLVGAQEERTTLVTARFDATPTEPQITPRKCKPVIRTATHNEKRYIEVYSPGGKDCMFLENTSPLPS